ncbi:CATRA conflict system CASPASE/TPR repeat-associated protein [Streptomyces sp. NPDC058691]|uniref:CATRA conflict system CASPASE/TPR repeat-associated protein n=1 Tax=Streptomyces sp. NPDC058691 TaxID=3346601 RepID=UPI00365E6B63
MHGIVKPSLIVTCFVPAVPEPGETSSHAYLSRLWDACGRLGMTAEFGGLPLPAEPFAGPVLPATDFTVLAAGAREAGPGIHAAFVFAEHDVLGLVALLAPNDLDAGPGQWDTLLDEWTAASTAAGVTGPPPAGILGEFRVFTALHRSESPRSRQSISELVRRHAPLSGEDDGNDGNDGYDETWWRGHDVTDHGFSVWRTGRGGPGDLVTHFCLLAPVRAERALDEWAWAAEGESGLRPLTHYLMHAAKVGYESRRYDEFVAREPLHARRAHSDRETLALLRALQPGTSGEPVSLRAVLAAAAVLERTQLGPHGALWTITQHRELIRTVAIAIGNMRLHAPRLRRVGAGSSWPERDLAAAETLIAQIEDDLEYLSAARERAEAARAAATAVTDRALSEYRNRLSLVQTSVLGSVLAALTVVQTLDYHLPLPRAAQSPTILVLTAVALFLPLAVLRQAAISTVALPYRWIDTAASGLLGSSLCWLAMTAWSLHRGDGLLPAVVTAPSCLAVGLAAALVYHRADRRS